jgi:hypothetical protein
VRSVDSVEVQIKRCGGIQGVAYLLDGELALLDEPALIARPQDGLELSVQTLLRRVFLHGSQDTGWLHP